MTLLTFKTATPENCGIVQLDEKNRVIVEKQKNPPSNLANGASYVFDKSFLVWLEHNAPNATDFSTEVIPLLMGKIFAHPSDGYHEDIGTIETYQAANAHLTGMFS